MANPSLRGPYTLPTSKSPWPHPQTGLNQITIRYQHRFPIYIPNLVALEQITVRF